MSDTVFKKMECEVCAVRITTMCFLGTGVCCEAHRKVRDEK